MARILRTPWVKSEALRDDRAAHARRIDEGAGRNARSCGQPSASRHLLWIVLSRDEVRIERKCASVGLRFRAFIKSRALRSSEDEMEQ